MYCRTLVLKGGGLNTFELLKGGLVPRLSSLTRRPHEVNDCMKLGSLVLTGSNDILYPSSSLPPPPTPRTCHQCAMSPHDHAEDFVLNYSKLMHGDTDITNFQKVLEMKVRV